MSTDMTLSSEIPIIPTYFVTLICVCLFGFSDLNIDNLLPPFVVYHSSKMCVSGTVETFSGKSSFNDIGRSTYIMSIVVCMSVNRLIMNKYYIFDIDLSLCHLKLAVFVHSDLMLSCEYTLRCF